MKLDDVKLFIVTFDLKRSPELRKLLKRVLRLRYRIAHRRVARDGEGTVDDLEELERQHKIALNTELLDWTKHGPQPGSKLLFTPSGLELRLPPARRGEHIEDFLTRLIRQLKNELEEPDLPHFRTKIGIDLEVGVHHRDG